MVYAFLPHFGSIWLCETEGPLVNPLVRVPGSPQAYRKFSTDGQEFGFREQAGKKIGHYRMLAQAPWFECLTPPTKLPQGTVVHDFVIHDGMFIAGGRSKTSESLWVYPPGAEQPRSLIPLQEGLVARGISSNALFVRNHTLMAIICPNLILLYDLSPRLSAQGVDKVELPEYTSSAAVTKSAEGKGMYALYSAGRLSVLCSKSLHERVHWRPNIGSRWASYRQSQSVEPIEPMAALLEALQDMAFCGEYLLLAVGTMGLHVSDPAFHRQVNWQTSNVAQGNPFFSVPLQKIVNVQRLECPRGQALGLYVVGLDTAGKLAYEWLGMEQLTTIFFGMPPAEKMPYIITIKAMPTLIDQTLPKMTESRGYLPKLGLVTVGGMSKVGLGDLASNLQHIHRTVVINTDMEIATQGTKVPRFNVHFAQSLAESAIPEIAKAVSGLDMVLLIADMGDSAVVGITPVVAQVLREQNILTLAIVISPFNFEGTRSSSPIQFGISSLRHHVHALLPINNCDVEDLFDDEIDTVESLFTYAPRAVIQLCRSITNSVVSQSSNVGISYELQRHLFQGAVENCAFGFGSASGAETATQKAIDHPFLGLLRLQQASAALVVIETAPSALFLHDSKNIMDKVRRHSPTDAIIGYSIVWTKPTDEDEFRVSILASGIRSSA